MLSIIWMILIDFVVGLLAKFVIHGGPKGFFMTSVLGIAGSIIATYLGRAIGHYPPGGSAGFIASFVGAIVLLLIYQAIVKSRGPSA